MEIDINKIPKKFVEKTMAGMGKEHFVIGMLCGDDLAIYALTPSQMKLTFFQLRDTIDNYEKTYHKIEDPSASGIPSASLLGNDLPKPPPSESGQTKKTPPKK